ncbi:uncharacterized protein LOC129136624 [Pan troglodytes]|uniref:uncharacterized protein LOC129136624 n=1 Tax=Pan troglodytes TaxID=9598 RepID=UPI0007DBEEE9|nr:uncharacterized protein LOC129136624 [Pan troglodytes]
MGYHAIQSAEPHSVRLSSAAAGSKPHVYCVPSLRTQRGHPTDALSAQPHLCRGRRQAPAPARRTCRGRVLPAHRVPRARGPLCQAGCVPSGRLHRGSSSRHCPRWRPDNFSEPPSPSRTLPGLQDRPLCALICTVAARIRSRRPAWAQEERECGRRGGEISPGLLLAEPGTERRRGRTYPELELPVRVDPLLWRGNSVSADSLSPGDFCREPGTPRGAQPFPTSLLTVAPDRAGSALLFEDPQQWKLGGRDF